MTDIIRNRCAYCGTGIEREDPADAWRADTGGYACVGADNGEQHAPMSAVATLRGIDAQTIVEALLANDADGAPMLAIDALHAIGAVWTCACWQIVPAGLHCTVCGGTQETTHVNVTHAD